MTKTHELCYGLYAFLLPFLSLSNAFPCLIYWHQLNKLVWQRNAGPLLKIYKLANIVIARFLQISISIKYKLISIRVPINIKIDGLDQLRNQVQQLTLS